MPQSLSSDIVKACGASSGKFNSLTLDSLTTAVGLISETFTTSETLMAETVTTSESLTAEVTTSKTLTAEVTTSETLMAEVTTSDTLMAETVKMSALDVFPLDDLKNTDVFISAKYKLKQLLSFLLR